MLVDLDARPTMVTEGGTSCQSTLQEASLGLPRLKNCNTLGTTKQAWRRLASSLDSLGSLGTTLSEVEWVAHSPSSSGAPRAARPGCCKKRAGEPGAPSGPPVGRNRSEAIVFCFAVALSARLRSNALFACLHGQPAPVLARGGPGSPWPPAKEGDPPPCLAESRRATRLD